MIVALALFFARSAPQTQPADAAKRPLEHRDYDAWKSIRFTALSDDGKWLAYAVGPQVGDGSLAVVATASPGAPALTIPRGTEPRFSADSKFLAAIVAPPYVDPAEAADRARPPGELRVEELGTGKRFARPGVRGFRFAKHDRGWLAYELAPPVAERPARASAAQPDDQPDDQRRGRGRGPRPGPTAEEQGSTWVVRKLDSGAETTLEHVADLVFDDGGDAIAFALRAPDAKANGIGVLNLRTGARTTLATGPGRYLHPSFSPDGGVLAYETDAADQAAKPPKLALFAWRRGEAAPRALASSTSPGMPEGWAPADGPIRFSRDGKRLLFPTRPLPLAPGKPERLAPEQSGPAPIDTAQVDVWNWLDKRLQSQQIHDLSADLQRGYAAAVSLAGGRVVQLERPELPRIQIGDRDSAPVGFLVDAEPYELADSWDEGRSDLYRVDLSDGKRAKLAGPGRFGAWLEPNGAHVVTCDLVARAFVRYDLRSGAAQPLRLPPTALFDREDDHPAPAPLFGIGPFTRDGKGLIVNDRYDLWLVDLAGREPARCLTGGFGRRWHDAMRLLPTSLDPDDGTVDVAAPLMLSVRNLDDDRSGFYRLAGGELKRLVFGPALYSGLVAAKRGDALVYARSTFQEFPDLWLTDAAWKSPVRVSDAEPEQRRFRWGSAELVHWTGDDGQSLKGLLFKPDGFDPSKKYPMITYYYEKDSAGLYAYRPPAPSASTINIAYFVSNGYIVFDPDIDYAVGYPGQSAFSSIIPGVQSILAKGYVDPKRLGLQGQSWGGYETAYLVTRTNMFAAAEAGAPVGDMFAAYGGIRGESGVVREGQYEHGQSRIGGTPWDRPLQYLDNSPVFAADRVRTPLLIMSNDADGAVPHTQGIELFTDLRRLAKPCWMLVYNNEQHNLVERRNRMDLSERLSQFFDHYLMGAPMPRWMSVGVPAIEKGKDEGFSLAPPPASKP